MNVVLPASRWPIAQVPCRFLYGKHGISFRFGLGAGGPQRGQLLSHMAGAVPGAKILGSEILLSDLP